MNFDIKRNSWQVTKDFTATRWNIETPLGEKFQILNQINNCYEIYESTISERLAKCEKFEDCLDWIREYTKYDW